MLLLLLQPPILTGLCSALQARHVKGLVHFQGWPISFMHTGLNPYSFFCLECFPLPFSVWEMLPHPTGSVNMLLHSFFEDLHCIPGKMPDT